VNHPGVDAIGLVRQDHRRLEALLERCEQADRDGAEERAVLVDQLHSAVRHHVEEEESILYPAFRPRDDGLLARATDQHRLLARLADELAATPPAADAFRPRLRVLADQVHQHLDAEDGPILTALEDLLDDDALLDLGRRLENRRRVVAAQEDLAATTTGFLTRRLPWITAGLAVLAALAAVAVVRRRRRARP
jgi:hemerythrin-like domain-containing protein